MSIRACFHRLLVRAIPFITLSAAFLSAAHTARAGYLYLLNDTDAGSTIYGFRVNEADGVLTVLAGFPVSAQNGGINSIVSERLIVDVTNKRLYVINDSSDTVSAYSISTTTGALTPMPFNPITLGTGVWNTIAVHPSGSPLIVANNALNGVIQSFVITPTTATPATGNPFPMTGAAGFSSAFSKDGAYYYVGGNSGNNFAGYAVDPSTGVLTALAGSAFNSGAAQPLAHDTDAAGRFFAVSSLNEVRVFTTSAGIPTAVTGNPFPSGLTARRFGRIHPSGNFYIVAGNSGNNVGVYQISGSGAATTVAAVPGSPFPTGGTTANCLAITSSGNYLYVGNRISRNVTTFSINTGTGVLTSLGVQANNTLGTTGAINGCGYLPDAAANAVISGRVVDAQGNGIGNVVLTLTDSQDPAATRFTITNPFGYHSFFNVTTGRTYTVVPSKKGYTFSPPFITFPHAIDVTNMNFTGQRQ